MGFFVPIPLQIWIIGNITVHTHQTKTETPVIPDVLVSQLWAGRRVIFDQHTNLLRGEYGV